MERTALLVGATGLVGKQLLENFLADDYYDRVLILGRRPVEVEDERIENIVVDFDRLEEASDKISAEDYYCSIGTTMKKAGSKEVFYKVDHDYPIKIGEMALKDAKFKRFLLVSSYGANADSSLFYNQVKGETEEALKKLKLHCLLIFQPSLLLGKRDDFRFFEEAGKVLSAILSFFIIGTRLRFWAIKDTTVAKAMYRIAKKDQKGIIVYKPLEMMKIADTNG